MVLDRTANARRLVRFAVGAAIVGLTATLAFAEAIPPADEAQAVVQDTVDQVLAVLKEKQWTVEKRVQAIEEIVYDRFDFNTISRLVLARNYKKFSPEQQVAFESEFKAYLSRSYGSRVDRYEQEKVDIVSARVEPRGDVTVRTIVVGGQNDGVELHYRMRKKSGAWLVIDVVIEGVSLVSNFRSQFQEVVSEGGPDLLLERLKQKNFAREAG
jgi:phospholipid transport system substrate-binding protein